MPFPKIQSEQRSKSGSWIACIIALSCPVMALKATDAINNTPHFTNEIVPILTKAGCNSGACHGAATGKGGFKLSLFAEDPQADYEAITRDRFARRLNLDHPEESLVLQKASQQIDHEGGRRLRSSSDNFARLKQWITHGAPMGNPAIACKELLVSSPEIRAKARGDAIAIKVEALMADGSRKDVTRWCVFDCMDEGIADVTGQGEVVFQNHGVTSVLIRFGALTSSCRVGLPYPVENPIKYESAHHPVDVILQAEWNKWNLEPETTAATHTLVRRLFLDLTGQIPSPEETVHWTQEAASDSGYHQLVKHLISTPDFADFWSLRFADWLLVDTKKLGPENGDAYYSWLKEQIKSDQSMLNTIRTLIEARGSFSNYAPANFNRQATDPRDMAEYVGQTLLGARIACARCHNHPVDEWTLTDYHDFAAIFSKTGLENGAVVFKDLGEVPHPKTGNASTPRPLGVSAGMIHPDEKDPIKVLGEWLATQGSDRFARAFANRIWKHLFGSGIVEPVDDLRSTNPPLIPNLLETLAELWSEKDYRFTSLIELVVTSNAYRQQSDFNAFRGTPRGFFNAMTPRAYEGRVLVDAIRGITQQPDYLIEVLAGQNAINTWDHRQESFALDVLGRCKREEPCLESGSSGGGLTKSLYLFNDPELQSVLENASTKWIQQINFNTEALLREVYLRTFSRTPTPEELKHWSNVLKDSNSKAEALSDMLWAMLNSREFLWIH